MELLNILLVSPMSIIDNTYVKVNGSLIKDECDSACPAFDERADFLAFHEGAFMGDGSEHRFCVLSYRSVSLKPLM